MDYFSAMRAFVDAAELGSFSKAAEQSGVKVSTVSRYISGLEADLGAALFNRSTRRITLTEVGRAFRERATRILADVDEARFAATALNAHPQGYLKINVPAAFGRRHVVPHLAEFRSIYPDIRVGAAFTEEPLDMIENGIDAAIRIGPLEDSSLVITRLAVQRTLLVSATGPADIETPADLAGRECLVPAQNAVSWFFRRADAPNEQPVAVPVGGNVHINDLEAALRAALDGLGIALLPAWLVAGDLANGGLRHVLPDWTAAPHAAMEEGVWGVYPPKKVVAPKVRAFLGFFGRKFARLG